jgi:flagellar hook-length control protein FliK
MFPLSSQSDRSTAIPLPLGGTGGGLFDIVKPSNRSSSADNEPTFIETLNRSAGNQNYDNSTTGRDTSGEHQDELVDWTVRREDPSHSDENQNGDLSEAEVKSDSQHVAGPENEVSRKEVDDSDAAPVEAESSPAVTEETTQFFEKIEENVEGVPKETDDAEPNLETPETEELPKDNEPTVALAVEQELATDQDEVIGKPISIDDHDEEQQGDESTAKETAIETNQTTTANSADLAQSTERPEDAAATATPSQSSLPLSPENTEKRSVELPNDSAEVVPVENKLGVKKQETRQVDQKSGVDEETSQHVEQEVTVAKESSVQAQPEVPAATTLPPNESEEDSEPHNEDKRRTSKKSKSTAGALEKQPQVKDPTLIERVQKLLEKTIEQSATADLESSESSGKELRSTVETSLNTRGGESTTSTETSTQRLASRLFSTGTKKPDSTVPRGVDQAQLLNRVAKAFEAARNRGGEVRIRLSPPELGALRIQIKVQDGVVSARLEAETQGAKQVLLENLGTLKERLGEQGLRVEQFDVDLPDPRGDQSGKDVGEQWREQQKRSRDQQQPAGVESDESQTEIKSERSGVVGDDELNVTV